MPKTERRPIGFAAHEPAQWGISTVAQCSIWPLLDNFLSSKSVFIENLAPTCSFFSVKVGKVKIGPRSYVGMYFQPLSLQLQILGMHLQIHRKKKSDFFHRNKIG